MRHGSWIPRRPCPFLVASTFRRWLCQVPNWLNFSSESWQQKPPKKTYHGDWLVTPTQISWRIKDSQMVGLVGLCWSIADDVLDILSPNSIKFQARWQQSRDPSQRSIDGRCGFCFVGRPGWENRVNCIMVKSNRIIDNIKLFTHTYMRVHYLCLIMSIFQLMMWTTKPSDTTSWQGHR